MKENPDVAVPNNYGDPLIPYEFGMHYGAESEFVYDTLVIPTEVVESTNAYGRVVASSQPKSVKSGESFTVSFLLWNNGDDGVATVKAYDGESEIAKKIVAVNDSSWRVVELELTLEGAGEHVISVGDLSTTIVVE